MTTLLSFDKLNLSQRAQLRSEAIRRAVAILAKAGSDVSGGTLILPDGTRVFLSAKDARRLHRQAAGEVRT